MTRDLREAVYLFLNGTPELFGRLYFTRAPQGASLPYAVFSSVTRSNSEDTAAHFADDAMQIAVYAGELTAAEAMAEAAEARCTDNEFLLNLPGITVDRMTVGAVRKLRLDDAWQIIIELNIETTKTKE